MSPTATVEFDVPLHPHTTLELGGNASHFVRAEQREHVAFAVRYARENGLPLLPLGGGSNLVVADAGVRGLVLRLATKGITERDEGSSVLVTVEAGEVWHEFVAYCVERHYAGVECLGGIPGSVGATPIQNVGAYGQEVGETIERVEVLDTESDVVRELGEKELAFSYRDSSLKRAKQGRYVVLSVTFRLRKGGSPKVAYAELKKALGDETPSLRKVFDTVLDLRSRKSMVLSKTDENRRCCGSFFVNVLGSVEDAQRIERIAGAPPPTFPTGDPRVKIASAWLIERAGFERGFRDGSVGLSTKHTLCLVAHEGATTSALLAFASKIEARVAELFGVELEREPVCWGRDPSAR